MNALAELISSEHDILYGSLAEVEFVDGKPASSLLRGWSLEDRVSKFWEFCRAYDRREDTMLKENYQQLSHRLHWHECPFVDVMKEVDDPQEVIEGSILFSFTNEHWQMFEEWRKHGTDGIKAYIAAGNRHSRHDLFQIYFPKGTNVAEWLIKTPPKVSRAMKGVFKKKNRPYTMMEFAKLLNEYFVEECGFRNAMYPSKNVARHVAMSHPEWVDPESFLWGGTGFFDGIVQVFDCPHYMSKGKYEIDENGSFVPLNEAASKVLYYMDFLKDHEENPIRAQKYLNQEDKLCMHYKFMMMKLGHKKQTKQIPYEWVYPKNWSLKTGKYE